MLIFVTNVIVMIKRRKNSKSRSSIHRYYNHYQRFNIYKYLKVPESAFVTATSDALRNSDENLFLRNPAPKTPLARGALLPNPAADPTLCLMKNGAASLLSITFLSFPWKFLPLLYFSASAIYFHLTAHPRASPSSSFTSHKSAQDVFPKIPSSKVTIK